MSERAVYVKRFENAREKMRQMVQAAQENPVIYESWRMKEVLDHITGWDDAMITSIQSLLAGEVPATPAERGIDYYNEETVSSREALPYALTRQEWEASRVELLRLINGMTEEQLHRPYVLPWGETGSIEDMVAIFTHHEETHANEIGAILRAKNII
jgi:hypothetical protein